MRARQIISHYTAADVERHIRMCRAIGQEPTEGGMVETECQALAAEEAVAVERSVRAAWAQYHGGAK